VPLSSFLPSLIDGRSDRARSTTPACGQAMARHRGYEQPVHRPLGRLEQVGRFSRIEAATTGCDGQLVVKRRSEAEEALDRLAEGQPECRGDGAVLGCRAGRLPEMVSRRLRLGGVQVLEEGRGEDVASFAEEEALLVAQGQDPGQLRRGVAARPTVGPRDPGWRQAGAPDRWAPRSISREETLEGRPGESPVAARRREDPQAARIAPAAQSGG